MKEQLRFFLQTWTIMDLIKLQARLGGPPTVGKIFAEEKGGRIEERRGWCGLFFGHFWAHL